MAHKTRQRQTHQRHDVAMRSREGINSAVLVVTTAALGDEVSNTRAADSGLARGVSPGESEVVGPPGLRLTTSSNVDNNGGEIGQACRGVCGHGSQLASLLCRASSGAEGVRGNGEHSLTVGIPRDTSDIEHATGSDRSTSNAETRKVKTEAGVGKQTTKTNLCGLIVTRRGGEFDHQVARGRLVWADRGWKDPESL